MAYATRIQQAVKNTHWQTFRRSLKGLSTTEKLKKLKQYYVTEQTAVLCIAAGGGYKSQAQEDTALEDVALRVDNYVKALCRGGQLHPGESLQTMIACDWMPKIKKD